MAAMRDLGLDRTSASTSTAAPAHWAIRSAPPARASSTTLLHALRARGLKRGIASLCIGGGEATAIAIETL